MKEKISIALSREVLNAVDRIAGSKKSRSSVIEVILAQYMRKAARARVEALDLELLNKAADELTPQIEDVLLYQDDRLFQEAPKTLIEREGARRLAALGGSMPDLNAIPRHQAEKK
ncbi:MAG TPA: hypothetical protein VMT67_13510 [Terriglobales bacterium]|nr:hypothetical protein [Terriglobales bacterium]